MNFKGKMPSGTGKMERRRKAILVGKFAAILLVPLIVIGYPGNPPAGESGASGGSTCGTASCHFHGTAAATGGITVTFPSGLTYTPGGPAVPLTVVATAGSGFELSAVTSAGAQAGSFTAGTNSTVATLSGIQYILQTATAATWSFTWSPPATDVGSVVMNIAGVDSSSQIYANVYTLTPASSGGTTLTVSPNTLTFSSASGATPPSQSFQVTSSGASVAFTTSTTTATGGNWLTAATGGTTPMGVSVSVNPAGLTAGTYTGTVAVASAAASNSPQNVDVTLTVTGPPPAPMLTLTPTALTFNSTGSSVPAKNVQVTSSSTALSFTAAVSTTTGGNWLSITPASGTTPATVAVSAAVTGLAAGTYSGSVVFTSSGASNSPQKLSVTLTVGTAPPPSTVPPLTFTFHALSHQSGGSERLLVTGSGSINSSGQLSGNGDFTIYGSSGGSNGASGEDDRQNSTIATGTWTAASATSFTPAAGRSGGEGGSRGGVLVITVNISPMGGKPMTGSMTITSTGTQRGVGLSINGGSSFVPSGTGSVSIRLTHSSGTGGGDDGSGGDN